MSAFAELAITTNFSFLRGASHPEEFVARAVGLGLVGIGIADRNTLAGIVRAHAAWVESGARETGLKLIVGARLAFMDGTPDILAYPRDRAGYGRLCRLLTVGKLRAEKGECHLTLRDLLAHLDGLNLIVMPPRKSNVADTLGTLRAMTRTVWLGAVMGYRGDDRRRLAGLRAAAYAARVPLVAVNDALYHDPDRKALQDVVTCIREKMTVQTAGRLLEANAERHLKSGEEMARLFRDAPEAVAETRRLLDGISFTLDELKYCYPDEPVPPGSTPQGHLEYLTWQGAAMRYPDGVPDKVRRLLQKELALIGALDYAPYFLTVHDIVTFARGQDILCQGRGSAANSAVCYVLGITAVDPREHNLLFERFISSERREPPDIDVDFEHERREEVIQFIYARYGRLNAGICATVISYRPRSAIRDVGKALGLSEDMTSALAGAVWGSRGDGLSGREITQVGLGPDNPSIRRAVGLANQIIGFPRHLSQHVGGFVLTLDRLDEMVPIGNAAMAERTFIEWDKDDIDTLRMMKVDVLGLGMLTCIRKAFDLLETQGLPRPMLSGMALDDPAVYAMLQKADSIGVFQVESRAQMNMLPRLRPKKFYDLVIEVAIVRPGPIQGGMVHPYLRRRQGMEKVHFPAPAFEHGPPDELEKVLGKTLGIPLFQEQAMRIAIDAAKFTPEEANRLRRAMATFRRLGTIHLFRNKMVEGMVGRGYERCFAEACFQQIEGFGDYGFPESHAASFALLVYVSAWLKCHHPAVFAAALLNSQPMGFYAPAQIVRDAREHGVEVRPVDVNASQWDSTLEKREDGSLALRLGFRQIEGFREDWTERIVACRDAPYRDLEALARHTRLERRAYHRLADADALRSLGLDRREGLWAARRLPGDEPLPLFAAARTTEQGPESDTALPAMALAEHVVADYQTLRLSLKAHPMSLLREAFRTEGISSCLETNAHADGAHVRTAGIVLVRQRPGSAKGVVFMTLEDETGIVNVVIWPKIMERFRKEVMGAKLVMIDGRLQKSPEGVVHLVADRIADRTDMLLRLGDGSPARVPLSHADEVMRPVLSRQPDRHPRDVRIIPRSRDFH